MFLFSVRALFIDLFVYLFIYLFIHSLIHSFIIYLLHTGVVTRLKLDTGKHFMISPNRQRHISCSRGRSGSLWIEGAEREREGGGGGGGES